MANLNDTGAPAPTQPRNPLISNAGPADTIYHCLEVLEIVDRAVSYTTIETITEDDAMGFHLTIDWVREALKYEVARGRTTTEDNVSRLEVGNE